MPSIYDRANIYDLLENQERWNMGRKHWETVLEGTKIRSLLDVSIGSGSVTLPLCELGVRVYGSDLSEDMLKRCREKAQAAGYDVELKCSDFRDLSCWQGVEVDCVASTGNSLPHVNNADVLVALEQMDAHVQPGGYLYLDTRNWDRILRERQRFYIYNPVFVDQDRINLVQVWDYPSDDSMTFNLLYTFERDNRIFQKEAFEETYYPISNRAIVEKLESLGYAEIRQMCYPAQAPMRPFEQIEWYCILAKKSNPSV